MIVVAPFCAKDAALCQKQWRHIASLGKWPAGFSVLALADTKTGKEAIQATVDAIKAVVGDKMSMMVVNAPEGWPQGPNAMWIAAASAITSEHWLWLEPDCTPLKAGWLEAINAEYAKKKAKYLGQRILHEGKPMLFGCAVYPPCVSETVIAFAKQSKQAFDVAIGPLIDHEAANSRLFSNFTGNKPGQKAKVDKSKIQPEAVLVHGESIIDEIKTRKRESLATKNLIENTKIPTGKVNHVNRASVQVVEKRKILLISLDGTTGYAEIGKLRLFELSLDPSVEVKWMPLSWEDSKKDQSALELWCRSNCGVYGWEYGTVWAVLPPDSWDHWRRVLCFEKQEFIGETIWETDKLPHDWVVRMNKATRIVASTDWNKQIFSKSGVIVPIDVKQYVRLPETIPARKTVSIKAIPDDYFVFYTIGQWTERKGISETVQAFCEEFKQQENVALLVKTHWTSYQNEAKQICVNRASTITSMFDKPPMVLINCESLSRQEILAIHSRGDCYVSLCKSEGLGLGAMDAEYFGKDVIITGWGGQKEVLSKAKFVNYTMIPVSGMDWIPAYNKTMNWAMPDIDHARKLMREVYESRTGLHS